MVRLPQSGPQRSEFSAGTVFRFPPRSFPPQKRGPRNRGGAAVAGAGLSAVGSPPARCPSGFKKKAPSVPRRLWWFDVLLVATQRSVVPGSRRSPGKRGVGKRGPRSRDGVAATERTSAQRVFRWNGVRGFPPHSFPPRKRGPRNRGGAAVAGAGLSAVGSPPARCPSGVKKKARSVPRRLWWFDVLLVAAQCSVVPGSWAPAILPGRENEGVGKRGPRHRGGAAATEWTSMQ